VINSVCHYASNKLLSRHFPRIHAFIFLTLIRIFVPCASSLSLIAPLTITEEAIDGFNDENVFMPQTRFIGTGATYLYPELSAGFE